MKPALHVTMAYRATTNTERMAQLDLSKSMETLESKATSWLWIVCSVVCLSAPCAN